MRKQYHDTHDPTDLVSPSPESSGDYEPTIGMMGQVASGTHLLWIPYPANDRPKICHFHSVTSSRKICLEDLQ
jgi:hypothetical protein